MLPRTAGKDASYETYLHHRYPAGQQFCHRTLRGAGGQLPTNLHCAVLLSHHTARPGDEITVLAVRQKNSPRSDNLDAFRRELDTLGTPYTLIDVTTPENQQRDALLTLFETLTDAMQDDACYYADATFGTKTYPLVLASALRYAEKILDDTEVCGIYYRELTRENGQVKTARQYDISTLFTLDGIVDMAAGEDIADKRAFIKLMLHPDREV